MSDYVKTGKLRIIYRHLFQISSDAVRVAEANECAGEQGKFWEMRAQLYAQQGNLYGGDMDAALIKLGGDLKLDTARLSQCMQSGKYRASAEADYADAQRAGIQARPVFDINGQRVVGYQPYEVFQQRIDALLKS